MTSQSWIGKSIGGRYQIDSLVGQGGMSAVYRATDPNLRRQVAIKLIHTHLSVDPNFINRFKEEAAAVARLRHPNIIQVHDFNIDSGIYYMVMEYLIGETLHARLKRLNAANRHMPYPEVIGFCTQLCDALSYAHNRELIHRDVKPANIMLDLNGQAILMDFGIVKIVGGDYHTATGATVGTAMYMSPEQIRSERVDERSDVYSLGVTLYEMISGRPPYQADSALTLMMMVLNDPLPDLREIRKGIPETLLVVVQKALAKEQGDRFQTMEEMAAALRQAGDQVASAASVVTVVDDEQADQARTQDTDVEGMAEIDGTPEEPARAAGLRHEELAPGAPQPELPGEGQSVSAVPTLRDPVVESISAPRLGLPSRIKSAVRLNYRGIAIVSAILLLLGAATAFGVIYIQSQQAPNSQTVLIDQPKEPINSQSAPFVVSLGWWETGSYLEELAYSPDGKRIGTANNRESNRFSKYRFYGGIWRVDIGSLQNYLLGHAQWVSSVAFSPDGQLFATASEDKSIILWQVSDGSMARKIDTSFSGITSVDFSPNNLLLAAGSWDGNVGLWQLSDGHLLRTLRGTENGVTDVKFSPEGNLLASVSEDQTISLWQVSEGSLLHTLRGHTGPIHKLDFSPDGIWLASASIDHTIGLWQVSDGSLSRSLVGHSETVFSVAFSPDGSLLASGSADGTVRLWRVTDGEILRLLTEHSDSVTCVAFSPDSHILVSGATDGTLRFWGLSEAIPLEIVPSKSSQ